MEELNVMVDRLKVSGRARITLNLDHAWLPQSTAAILSLALKHNFSPASPEMLKLLLIRFYFRQRISRKCRIFFDRIDYIHKLCCFLFGRFNKI